MQSKIYDVCVIGAGISGLFCAYLLSHDPNINICLIEKSPHVGGRIRSNNWEINNKIFTVENGAYRFNPNDHPILWGLIKHFGMEKYVYELKSRNVFFPLINDSIEKALKHSKTNLKFKKIGVLIDQYFNDYGKNMNVDDASKMYGYPTDFDINASWFETDGKNGAMNSKDQYYSLLDEKNNKGLSMITDCLCEILKKQNNVDVYLKTFVEKLNHNQNQYFVKCKQNKQIKKFQCKTCFIGLPLKAVKKIKGNTIQSFDHLFHSIKEGDYIRLYAHFPVGYKEFLSRKGFPFIHMPKIIGKTCLGQIVPHEKYDCIAMISYCEDSNVSKMMDILQPQNDTQSDKQRINETLVYYVEKHIDTFFEWMEKYVPEKYTLYKPYQNVWKQFLTSFDDLNLGMWESVIGKWQSRILIEKIQKQLAQPMDNLHIIGEVVSEKNHGWMEGALDTAFQSYKNFKNEVKSQSYFNWENIHTWNRLHPGGKNAICPFIEKENVNELKKTMQNIHHGQEAFLTMTSLSNLN